MKFVSYTSLMVIGLVMLSAGLLYSQEIKSDHPNVILIMADDLGWGDIGFNGNIIHLMELMYLV